MPNVDSNSSYLDYQGLQHFKEKLDEVKVNYTDLATTTKAGLITAADYNSLQSLISEQSSDGITNTLSSGARIATIVLHGTTTTIYAPNSTATNAAAGLMSAADKKKLDGIEAGANKYTHPAYTAKTTSAIYKIKVDATGHVNAATAANSADILALGNIASTNLATNAAAGLMSAEDKNKLDHIEDSHPSHDPHDLGLYKFANDNLGHITTVSNVTSADILALGNIASTNTASNTAAGLMSSSDKEKLDAIEAGANKYVHPSNFPAKSTQALYKIKINSEGHVNASTAATSADILALGNIASTNAATTSTDGLMSSSDKSKLDAFEQASNYAKKSDISSVYKAKGSVADYAHLPTTGVQEGDVYNCLDTDMNYVYTASGTWDPLGSTFSITAITNAEIDTMFD